MHLQQTERNAERHQNHHRIVLTLAINEVFFPLAESLIDLRFALISRPSKAQLAYLIFRQT